MPMSLGRRDAGEGRRGGSGSLWLVIFADMSTNLMFFFLILFAMTRMSMDEREHLVRGMEMALSDRDAIAERTEAVQREESAMQSLEDVVAYGSLKQYARVQITGGRIKLTLEMPFFFPTGRAELTEEAMAALKGLVVPLRRFPGQLIIEGHTDDRPVLGGRYASNWELSVARAVKVIEYFTLEGVDEGKFVAAGYGEYRPIAANDTPEHRAMNRRIEITVLRVPR